MDKEEVLKLQQEKLDKLNIMQEKEGVKAGIESKGYGESKYASNQDPYKADEKENMKREKARDDHPLKELRYILCLLQVQGKSRQYQNRRLFSIRYPSTTQRSRCDRHEKKIANAIATKIGRSHHVLSDHPKSFLR